MEGSSKNISLRYDLGSECPNPKLIQSLQFQLQQRVLQAPTNGTIFQLSVNNAGTVLQPGQAIIQIALRSPSVQSTNAQF